MRAWQNDYAMDCKSIYEGLIPSALSKLKKEKNMKFDLEKLIEQLTDLLNQNKNLKYQNGDLKNQIDELKSELKIASENANSRMVYKLENEVSENRKTITRMSQNLELRKNKIERLEKDIKRLFEDAYRVQGHRYVFSEIPNTAMGQTVIDYMKMYLNKKSYKMRIRGQFLNKEKLDKGETWETYKDGQPLDKSKCIRVYLDKKRGEK